MPSSSSTPSQLPPTQSPRSCPCPWVLSIFLFHSIPPHPQQQFQTHFPIHAVRNDPTLTTCGHSTGDISYRMSSETQIVWDQTKSQSIRTQKHSSSPLSNILLKCAWFVSNKKPVLLFNSHCNLCCLCSVRNPPPEWTSLESHHEQAIPYRATGRHGKLREWINISRAMSWQSDHEKVMPFFMRHSSCLSRPVYQN